MILALLLFAFAFTMCMFPKQLPRAAVRKRIASERRKRGMKSIEKESEHDEIPASLSDMIVTFKRLFFNLVFMLNNLASIFYYFGYMRKSLRLKYQKMNNRHLILQLIGYSLQSTLKRSTNNQLQFRGKFIELFYEKNNFLTISQSCNWNCRFGFLGHRCFEFRLRHFKV